MTDTAQANKILLALCDSVASRMRADGRRCSCVTVTIRGNDFRNKFHQRKLPEPTDATEPTDDTTGDEPTDATDQTAGGQSAEDAVDPNNG